MTGILKNIPHKIYNTIFITEEKPYIPYNYALDVGAYIFSIILCIAAIILKAAINIYDVNIQNLIPPCMLHAFTGYYCPGCGGTRSVICMLNGDIFNSILYNPIVIYIAIPGLVFMLSHTVYLCQNVKSKHTKKTVRPLTIKPGYLYTAAGLILIQFIIKNLIKLIWNQSII